VSLMSWFKNLFSRAERPKEVALGRNDLCWCGSGKKYKKCHLDSDAAKEREANYAALFAQKSQGDGITRSGRKAPLPPENTSPQPRR
jgi:SEC-C motif